LAKIYHRARYKSMATSTPAAQQFVPLREVRDGIVLMKDGGMRAILMASSINFALKSEDEQQAILGQFQQFLNTLDFSLQIYVQSRELDITPYLELLRAREPGQDNDLMRVQLREYIGFIEHFTTETDIMTKSFWAGLAVSGEESARIPPHSSKRASRKTAPSSNSASPW